MVKKKLRSGNELRLGKTDHKQWQVQRSSSDLFTDIFMTAL